MFRLVKYYNYVFGIDMYDKLTKKYIQLFQDLIQYDPSYMLFKRNIMNYDILTQLDRIVTEFVDKHNACISDFYEIPTLLLKNNEEFCIKYPELVKNKTIPIPSFFVKEYTKAQFYSEENARNFIQLGQESRFTMNCDDLLQMHSDVFRRYDKKAETIVLNDNKESSHVVDIKDTLSPMLMLASKEINKYSKEVLSVTEDNPYFFNPNIAKMLNSKTVTLDMYFELFNINRNELESKLKHLKDKQIHLLMIGLGGTMSNFCYFMNELSKEFKLDHIFDLLSLYEIDVLELSNLFRIPLDYVTPIFYNTRTHTRYLSEEYNTKDIPYKAYMLFNCKHLYNNMMIHVERFGQHHTHSDSFNDFDFIIGSPDIATRIAFSENNVNNFICPLHYNNDLIILTNPSVVKNELMNETYGSIHLSYFFLNMFKMTMEVIDLMLKDKLDYNAKVLEYSSKDDLENIKANVSKSKNSYIIC